jgi:hypothetical protein
MAARLIGFIFIGLVLFALILVGTYMLSRSRSPKVKVELDVSTRPSLWWSDTRSIRSDTFTEVGIVRVDNHTHEVLERRVLEQLPNNGEDYAYRLDAAQDRAYDAARKANLGLVRR